MESTSSTVWSFIGGVFMMIGIGTVVVSGFKLIASFKRPGAPSTGAGGTVSTTDSDGKAQREE